MNPAALHRDEIVLLEHLPPELPPVAGIITLGAVGSLSHVSLLARNLGIPHVSVDGDAAQVVRQWVESRVVVTVSPGRRVVLGPWSAFEPAEQKMLADQRADAPVSFRIDESRLDLRTAQVLTLNDISPADAGIRVGPKAAELARLKTNVSHPCIRRRGDSLWSLCASCRSSRGGGGALTSQATSGKLPPRFRHGPR